MKRINIMNKLTVIALLVWIMLGFISPVYAAASATVGFKGNSTVAINKNITVTMYVSNVNDTVGGVVSVGGNLTFDDEYLEYVSGTGVSTPYAFQINTDPGANYKIAGVDATLSNGITGSGQTTIFTFVFKALKKGTTQVTINDARISDTSKKITANVSPLTITITDGTSTPTTEPSSTPSTSSSTEPSTNPSTPAASKSSDATLKSLSASGYTLSPSFSSSKTSYTVKVPSSATVVRLEGEANDSKASVSGLGTITLTGDTTTANVKVTAEDGTIKTYTVTIEREKEDANTPKKDSDATLKSLDVSGYTLSPTFDPKVNIYSMNVKNNITALDVEAIANSSKAKVSISGNSGWKEGVNAVTITVTAEDGTVNKYIVNVNREASSSNSKTTTTSKKKSSDNYLKNLTINSSHEISPNFDKNTMTYNITVPYEVDKLDLSYLKNNSKSKVTITGNEDFKVGEVNIVEIKVEAEDGSIRIYTLNVTRSTATGNTDLKDIIIKDGTLSPKFDPSILEYDVKVGSDVDKLDIEAIAKDSGAVVEIIGNEDLKEGNNTVLVKVTDKNGFTKYYTLNVFKEAKEVSNGNTIFGLTPLQFGIIASIIGLLLLLLLLLLFKRRKKEEKVSPTIEFKPEFNFGSKNTSDDDVVHGNFNQDSDLEYESTKTIEKNEEDDDPFEDTVTKDEIVDAIREATKTKDPTKLQLLLEQDDLNKKKKKLQEKEENLKRKIEEYDEDE